MKTELRNKCEYWGCGEERTANLKSENTLLSILVVFETTVENC